MTTKREAKKAIVRDLGTKAAAKGGLGDPGTHEDGLLTYGFKKKWEQPELDAFRRR